MIHFFILPEVIHSICCSNRRLWRYL